MTTLKISYDYDLFSFVKGQREISAMFVRKLIADPTFPDIYPSHPIIVNKDFGILDGQHRFSACKHLKLPIYYFVQEKSSENVPLVSHANTLAWRVENYVDYYSAQGNESYKLLKVIHKRYGIALSTLIYVVASIRKVGDNSMRLDFKTGRLKIENPEFFEKICDAVFIPLLDIRMRVGREESAILFVRNFIVTMARMWINERETFDRLMKKLPLHFRKLGMPRTVEEAEDMLTKIANMKMPKGVE